MKSAIEIIADILRTGENEGGETEMLCTANSSCSQDQRYLKLLLEKQYLQKVNLDANFTVYRITDSGKSLLRTIDTIAQIRSHQEN